MLSICAKVVLAGIVQLAIDSLSNCKYSRLGGVQPLNEANDSELEHCTCRVHYQYGCSRSGPRYFAFCKGSLISHSIRNFSIPKLDIMKLLNSAQMPMYLGLLNSEHGIFQSASSVPPACKLHIPLSILHVHIRNDTLGVLGLYLGTTNVKARDIINVNMLLVYTIPTIHRKF